MAELIVPLSLRDQHKRGLARCLATGEGPVLNRRLELTALRADGSEFPVEVAITRIPTDGQPLFTAYVRDISERKRKDLHRAVRLSVTQVLAQAATVEGAHRDLCKAMGETLRWDVGAVWLVDSQAQVLWCTELWHGPEVQAGEFEARCRRQEFARGVGLPGRVWAGRKCAWIADLRDDGNFPRTEVALRAGLHGAFGFPILLGEAVLGVLEFFHREAREPDEDLLELVTTIGAQIGLFMDRKWAEAQLRESEQRLRQITENLREVTFLCNADASEVYYISPVYEAVWGRSCASLYEHPRSWLDAVHPDDRPRVLEALKRLILGQPFIEEFRVVKPDGTVRWIRERALPVPNQTGTVYRIAGSAEDITDQRLLEEQFRQAQKMEAIGKLAGGVAHDFNNLLTVINGYGDLILDQLPRDDPNSALLREIVKAGDQAASLTRQLLAFSRKQIVAPRVLDLGEVLTDAEQMLRRVIGEDIQLRVDNDPALLPVKADAGQLDQVLLNLAVNARDAMPKGGTLSVATQNVWLDETFTALHPGARVGPHVLLSVSDSGIGMDPVTKARIFEPFFTTKGDKGTGIGLATVYGIVKQGDGYVEVESEPGCGATFKLYFPAIEETPASGKSHRGLHPMPRGDATILLVEDEEGVRALSRHVLKNCGYNVLEASDGVEALRVAGRHAGPIHLVVTDVVMPELSGREMADQLLRLHPEIRVLFLSGYTDDAVIRHGVREAETNFLQKPFSHDALAQKVREVLDANQARSA
jgi:PAS domain S-box-containing protein